LKMRKLLKMSFGYQNGRRTKPKFWQPKKRSAHVVSFTPSICPVHFDKGAGKANENKQSNIDQTSNTTFGRIVAFFRSFISLLRTRFFRFRGTLPCNCFLLVLSFTPTKVFVGLILWFIAGWFFTLYMGSLNDSEHD